jgi:glycosyltransferase involved in cell wall biosynthesis
LGRIAPEKGQLTMVQAARIATARDPELTFEIAGAAVFADQSYADQVRREAGSNVNFTGWTEDIGEFFNRTDLLVVPSEAIDANPRVIPEAYAAGVPVVAFDSGGVSELLCDGETGLLVREHSAHALAAAMLDAVRDSDRLDRFAVLGHQRWKERYTLPRFQSEVCDALVRAVAFRNVPASATA